MFAAAPELDILNIAEKVTIAFVAIWLLIRTLPRKDKEYSTLVYKILEAQKMRNTYLPIALAFLLIAPAVQAQPERAAVKIVLDSHKRDRRGVNHQYMGSGVIVQTGKGYAYCLTCSHIFEDSHPLKKIRVYAPYQLGKGFRSGDPRKGWQVVYKDRSLDLALLRYNYGPFPYTAPVAPSGYKPSTSVVSIGYDFGKAAGAGTPQIYGARLTGFRRLGGYRGNFWHTREKPRQGRSGGPLLDKRTGYTVGICHGYIPSGGLYVDLKTINLFMSRAAANIQGNQTTNRQYMPSIQPRPVAIRPRGVNC